MNCIIVEDDIMTRFLLRKAIEKLDFLNLVAECENPLQAINVLRKEQIDLVFLDICMPEMTGIEFLNIDSSHLTILITSKREFAVEAFEHNAVDYIVKPISKDRFIKAVNRAYDIFLSQNQTVEIADKEFITIRDKGVFIKIRTSDILYFQALGDYVTIYTINNKYTVRLQLKTVLEKLSHQKFMRIHRSYIIAMDKVDYLDENLISIDKNLIPVSDQYRAELIKKLNLL